ncbi:unnamed protein product [Ilex paraguariensis]|uniref:Uncharacterized protein n=1 Tax=Ilex paraguariensis TaxID=185542 RepID=A0ABC8QR42_9AQUA
MMMCNSSQVLAEPLMISRLIHTQKISTKHQVNTYSHQITGKNLNKVFAKISQIKCSTLQNQKDWMMARSQECSWNNLPQHPLEKYDIDFAQFEPEKEEQVISGKANALSHHCPYKFF